MAGLVAKRAGTPRVAPGSSGRLIPCLGSVRAAVHPTMRCAGAPYRAILEEIVDDAESYGGAADAHAGRERGDGGRAGAGHARAGRGTAPGRGAGAGAAV